jgi:hypothetical protein
LPAKNDNAVIPANRVMAFAGKSDRRTARSYKCHHSDVNIHTMTIRRLLVSVGVRA